jgi:hypothetical protein
MTESTEQHSATSLASRLGVTRAAALGAISAGRLVATSTTVGLRRIYTLKTASIADYKQSVLTKLQARIALVENDPIRRTQLAAATIRNIRTQVAAENDIYTPQRLADRFGIGLEAASYLLGRYAVRVENGFKVDQAALAAIEKHINETRGGAAIRNAGGPYVA